MFSVVLPILLADLAFPSAAVVAVLAGWLVRRWTASGGWTDLRPASMPTR